MPFTLHGCTMILLEGYTICMKTIACLWCRERLSKGVCSTCEDRIHAIRERYAVLWGRGLVRWTIGYNSSRIELSTTNHTNTSRWMKEDPIWKYSGWIVQWKCSWCLLRVWLVHNLNMPFWVIFITIQGMNCSLKTWMEKFDWMRTKLYVNVPCCLLLLVLEHWNLHREHHCRGYR